MGFNVLKKILNNVVGKEKFILVRDIYNKHLEEICYFYFFVKEFIGPLSLKTLVVKAKILRCCEIFAANFYP
jgi:hypothetical protein